MIEQRNVTKAAQSLCVSQPAVSHALARLRVLFDDEMFVRTPDGMMPTQRCVKISQLVTASLNELVDAIQPEEKFNPSESSSIVRIAMSDLLTGLLPSVVLPKVRSVAPNIEFRILPARGLTRQVSREEIFTSLDGGAIDLAFTWNYEIPGRFSWSVLGDIDYVCVGSRFNDGFEGSINRRYYEAVPQVSTSVSDVDLTRFDRELAEVGVSRNIKARVPHYSGALALVAETDMIASIPRILTDVARRRYGLKVSELPFISPNRSINMVWHKTRDSEPFHVWLRDFVAGCYRELEIQKWSTDMHHKDG